MCPGIAHVRCTACSIRSCLLPFVLLFVLLFSSFTTTRVRIRHLTHRTKCRQRQISYQQRQVRAQPASRTMLILVQQCQMKRRAPTSRIQGHMQCKYIDPSKARPGLQAIKRANKPTIPVDKPVHKPCSSPYLLLAVSCKCFALLQSSHTSKGNAVDASDHASRGNVT